MNKTNMLKIVLFISGFVFLLAGCASLEKARSLHDQGKDREALKMAAKYLEDGDYFKRRGSRSEETSSVCR